LLGNIAVRTSTQLGVKHHGEIMMNWDAIGALGEIIGAAAVVASLVYLALQMKQNSSLTKAELNQSGLDAFSRFRQFSMENSYIVAKLEEGGELDKSELVIARYIVAEGIFAAATLFETAKTIAPERTKNFVTVGVSILERHNWSFADIEIQLNNGGYNEFVQLIKTELDQRHADA
jgi:hypothetical protein